MRVTNGMIRQNMMHGLNNNMSKLNTLYNQMNTLKKVQRPSDDPIITGRALKLRLNVLETEQYTSNTKEAESWMSTSESALNNTTEILKDIRTRCVQAATDSLEKKDRDKILTDIKQLWEQLQQEANVTYAGRYVFSGFKTDQPIILNQDTKLKEDMTLNGDFKVLEDIKASSDMEIYEPSKGAEVSATGEVKFTNDTKLVGEVTLTQPTTLNEEVTIGGTTYKVGDTIPAGTVLPAGVTVSAGTTVENTSSFKLDEEKALTSNLTLDHDVVLKQDITVGGKTYKAGETVPKGTDIPGGTTLPKGTKLPAGTDVPVGTKVIPTTKVKAGETIPAGTTIGERSEIPAGTIITKGNVNLEILQQENAGKKNSSDLQEVQYEIGVGSTITVNTVGMANLMQDIGADIREMITALEDVDKGVPGAEEKLSDIFTKKQGALDERLAGVSDKMSDLGSRATRLEYTRNRLGEDKTNFTELLSNTEDVDLEEVYVEFNSQYMVYQSALQATSKVIMNTLADFLK